MKVKTSYQTVWPIVGITYRWEKEMEKAACSAVVYLSKKKFAVTYKRNIDGPIMK